MLDKLRSLSLRWKLSFALVALAMSVVGMYVVIAKNTFESDKIAYVFDSRQTNLGALSESTSVKFEQVLLAGRLLLLQVDLNTKKLNSATQAFFEGQKSVLAVELSDETGKSIVTLAKSVTAKTQLEQAATAKGVTIIRSLGQDDYIISSRERDNGANPWVIKLIAHVPDLLPPEAGDGTIVISEGDDFAFRW